MPFKNKSPEPHFNIKKIFVCMASSEGNHPPYRSLAKAVGSRVDKHGYGLVYGGGQSGLMGIVANAARRENAKIKAVMTRAFTRNPDDSKPVDDDTVVVQELHHRKAEMIQSAQATIIIPGGIGTLDEAMEVMAVNDMMRFENEDHPIHPLIIINEGGFYSDLLSMFKKTVEIDFANIEKYRSMFVVNSADEAFDLIDRLNQVTALTAKSLFRNEAIPADFPQTFADIIVEQDRVSAAYAREMGLSFIPRFG
jgi:cytokinin riboside 5'-monophosphate phosphoribohydrolase